MVTEVKPCRGMVAFLQPAQVVGTRGTARGPFSTFIQEGIASFPSTRDVRSDLFRMNQRKDCNRTALVNHLQQFRISIHHLPSSCQSRQAALVSSSACNSPHPQRNEEGPTVLAVGSWGASSTRVSCSACISRHTVVCLYPYLFQLPKQDCCFFPCSLSQKGYGSIFFKINLTIIVLFILINQLLKTVLKILQTFDYYWASSIILNISKIFSLIA